MTAHDSTLHTPPFDAVAASPPRRRRRSSSSASATKRSPSPRILLSGAPDSKGGVQNITRKVIRKLEELGGHMEIVEVNESSEEETVVENALTRGATPELQANGNGNGVAAHGVANGDAAKEKAKEALKKIDWEIPRKLFHSSIGFFTIYLYVSQGTPVAVVRALWGAFCIILPLDFVRFRYPQFERLYERVVGFLMRDCERDQINGVVWYILGVNFALTAYPLDVATVAILILSWADTAASTIGRAWGRLTPPLPRRTPVLRLPLAPRKSLAGFIGASVTGALIAVGFWTLIAPVRPADMSFQFDLSSTSGCVALAALALWAGLVSGVAEALDLGLMDDNLTLPIISGGCLFGFFKVLNWIMS
ncbi:hypothetical protein K525DRAFT_225725, partial [Schizophyllum commune Loenen D]